MPTYASRATDVSPVKSHAVSPGQLCRCGTAQIAPTPEVVFRQAFWTDMNTTTVGLLGLSVALCEAAL